MGIACTCARNNLDFAERHSNCFARAPCRNVAAVDANIRIIRLIRTKMVRAWWQHKHVTACYSLWPSFFTNGQFCVVRLSCQLSKLTDRLGYVVPCEWSESWGSGGGIITVVAATRCCNSRCTAWEMVSQDCFWGLCDYVSLGQLVGLRFPWYVRCGGLAVSFWSACLDLCRGRE